VSEPARATAQAIRPEPAARPGRPALAAWSLSVVLAAILLVASGGNPAVVVGILVVAAAGLAVWHVPLRWPVLGLLLVTQLIDDPSARPAAGEWTSPLAPLASLLYDNLHKLTGIDALRFSLLDLLVLALLGLALLRRLRGTAARDEAAPAPAPFAAVVAGAALAILLLVGWGLLRGGDFRNSLWQVRQLLFLPLVTLLFLVSLRGIRDLPVLGAILMGSALAKTALGLWVNETVFRPRNIRPAYVTTHGDSMLFALAFIAVLVAWNERRTRRTWSLLLLAGPLLLLAMKINNRRLVFVEVAAALAVVFPLVPWTRLKRNLVRAVLLALPLAGLYLAVGWSSTAGVFRPVKLVRSIVQPEADRSTAMRDIENFNLTVTFRASPLLGVGFGHPYVEQVRADDISGIFSLYRYIPHNSVLGLWAFCGTLGFAAIWLPMMTGLFLSVRAYRLATEPLHRTAALVTASMVVIHLLQAWGDMGIQAWSGVFLLGACLATSAQLAVGVGAYPAPWRPAPSAGPAGPGREFP
jgi:hypothetical protein